MLVKLREHMPNPADLADFTGILAVFLGTFVWVFGKRLPAIDLPFSIIELVLAFAAFYLSLRLNRVFMTILWGLVIVLAVVLMVS